MTESVRRTALRSVLAVLVAVGSSGCGSPPEASPGAQERQELPLQLEWNFDRDTATETIVASMLENAIQTTEGLHRGASGVMYDFGTADDAGRLLLLTYVADSLQAAEATAVLLVLQQQPLSVSSPLSIGRWTIGGFGPVEIADYDDDGLLDVAMCIWPNDETQDGAPTVSGFRNGSWYTVTQPLLELPSCEA